MNLKDLPERIKELLSKPRQDREELRHAFETTIATLRAEAIAARTSSGIEDVWTACEEGYAGIDDTNREEDGWIKPLTMQGSLRKARTDNGDQATVFIRMTAKYVDAGSAKLSEITDSIDEKPFSLGPTPVPDLVAGQDDERPITVDGKPVVNQDGKQAQVKDAAKAMVEKAEKSAKKAETRIHDWLVECGHAAEMRKVRFDAARLGVGVLKGPVPDISKSRAVSVAEGVATLTFEEKTVPVTRWVSPWNFYPAPGCGDNIHNGEYVFERDTLSTRQLRRLMDNPAYDAEAIALVLKEGPQKAYVDGKKPEAEKKASYEIWYFYGEIKTDDLAMLNPKQGAQCGSESVFAIVTMVNDHAIRATMNPLDSGSFPYHTFSWSRRAGSWAGVGPGEQLFGPQAMVNAATRTLIDNAGKSAGSQIVVDREQIEPAVANDWKIRRDKLWFKKPGGSSDDIRKAFAMFEIPNQTQQLLLFIEYAWRLAEESTNIPMISQGQSGDTTPDTFAGQQLQDNNANQLLRSIGMAQADSITKPLIDQMYEWLLLDPDVPAEEKGDFKCSVTSAYAMIERALQDQFLLQMGGMTQNPAFKIDPAKWFALMCKTKRLDPSDVQYTEAEQQKMDEQPPPPAPQVQAAQIRAESAERIAEGHDQVIVQKSRDDTDRDAAYETALNQRAAIMLEGKDRELALKRELEVFKENNSMKKELDKLKASLAETTMELQTQKQLAIMANRAAQVADTKMEPVGRADDGHAFEQ